MKGTKITRVESVATLGFPDCVLALAGKLFLVELKIATPSGRVKISPHQVAFHVGHQDFPCFILVKMASVMYLIPAANVKNLLLEGRVQDVDSRGWFTYGPVGFRALEQVLALS
jgi:hypothetical protein